MFCILSGCGSGKMPAKIVQPKKYLIENYSSIELSSPAAVYYEQSSESMPTLRIETDKNNLEYVNVIVKKGVLLIKLDKKVKDNDPIKIYTSSRFLSKLSLKGSGSITLQGNVQADKLDIKLDGSGIITSESLNAEKIDASMKGSGSVMLNGKTKDLSIKIKGRGAFDGGEMDAQNVKCDVDGTGSVILNVSSSLDAKVKGSGTINYSGSANKIKKSIRGSGDVNKITK